MMKFLWPVLMLAAVRFLTTAIAFPPLDGDLEWQRRLGQTILHDGAIPRRIGSEAFSAPFSAWVPQEWLFGIGVAVLPPALFATLAAACAVGAVYFVVRRCELRAAAPRVTLVCTLLATFALMSSFGVRAQVVGWLFASATVYVLERRGRSVWLAIPLAAIWSNLHASAMLAPILCGAYALSRLIDEPALRRTPWRDAPLVAGAGAAICLNPFGFHLPLYALSLFTSPIRKYIDEWGPTDLTVTSFALGSLPLLAILLVCGVRSSRRSFDIMLTAMFGWLMLTSARNIALFAIVLAPVAADTLCRRLRESDLRRILDPAPATHRFEARLFPAVMIAVAAALTFQLFALRAGLDASDPRPALATLERTTRPHRLFCADFAVCSYALGRADIGVFLDGRADPFPPRVWEDFGAIIRPAAEWRGRLDAYAVDAVLVEPDAPLDQAIALAGGWHERYRDKHFRLWQRAPKDATTRLSDEAAGPPPASRH